MSPILSEGERVDLLKTEYHKGLFLLGQELIKIHSSFNRIIFPGRSACLMWEDLKPEIGWWLRLKIKPVDKVTNARMTEANRFGKKICRATFAKVVGRARKILVVDDVVETEEKSRWLREWASAFDKEVDSAKSEQFL